MEDILNSAIQSVQQSDYSFCKFLSANDTKSTGGHQSGYLIGKGGWRMFFDKMPEKGGNIKLPVTIKWQDDFETASIFTYYGAAKNEFRLTSFGRGFPYREDENTGDLFVLCQPERGRSNYKAYILSADEDIDNFLAAVNISANQTNALIPPQFKQTAEDSLLDCFKKFLSRQPAGFPSTMDLAVTARNCFNNAYGLTESVLMSAPDKGLLNWLDAEYQLFRLIETDRYTEIIQRKFESVEELIETANTILNRRKSRAGKSLEYHLAAIFDAFRISYATQAVTEHNKKPDFLFPGSAAYHDIKFDINKMIVLASKTTCKDRWRQILNEADKIPVKHLFTLQQGISGKQLTEMYSNGVCLVVPKPYLSSFPKNFQERILTLEAFVKYVRDTQGW